MERITNENKQTEQTIKRKLKLDEIESVKKQKILKVLIIVYLKNLLCLKNI